APAGVDLVQQRAGRIVEPRRGGLLRLQVVPFETCPALQGVVMPRAARHVLIDVKVAVREDVEPGALLVTDDDRHRVLKLLAKAAASRRTPRTVAATSVRCLHYNSPLDPLDRSELTGRQSYSVPLCLGG